jgi:hypothetical protein
LFDYTESFVEDSLPETEVLFGNQGGFWRFGFVDFLLVLLELRLKMCLPIVVEGVSD